jgi:hypothetical protein
MRKLKNGINAAKGEILIASGSQGVLDAVGKVFISNSNVASHLNV